MDVVLKHVNQKFGSCAHSHLEDFLLSHLINSIVGIASISAQKPVDVTLEVTPKQVVQETQSVMAIAATGFDPGNLFHWSSSTRSLVYITSFQIGIIPVPTGQHHTRPAKPILKAANCSNINL